MINIKETVFEPEEYGCIYLKFDISWWDNFINNIKYSDIYDIQGYGIEKEPHVTILYGLLNDVTIEDIRKYKKIFDLKINIKLTEISAFKNNNFEVLKFDVESSTCVKLNEFIKVLPYKNSYNSYIPHMTISYLNPFKSDLYCTKLTNSILLSSNNFIYSDRFGNKTII